MKSWYNHIFNLCTCPQIALFMEMTPSHLSSTLLKHVSLKFYLDDSAHLLQPLNQGIVRDFKAYFRRRLLQTALAHSSAGDGGEERDHQTMKTVTELDAMFWIQVRQFEHSLFSLSVKVFWMTSTNILEGFFFWGGGWVFAFLGEKSWGLSPKQEMQMFCEQAFRTVLRNITHYCVSFKMGQGH